MKDLLTYAAIALIIYFVIVKFFSPAGKKKSKFEPYQNQKQKVALLDVDEDHQEKLLAIQRAKYRFQKEPINATERRVFFRLKSQLQKKGLNLYCQPQTTIGAFVRYQNILPGMCSRADILITTTNFDAHSIIEINGTGHHTSDASKRMEIKRSICDAVGIPIYAIEVTNQMTDEEIDREVSTVVERLA